MVRYSHLLKNFPQYVVIHTVERGALQQKFIAFKIKINTSISQKCIFLDLVVKKQLLDREQHTGSKLEKEYVKAVYCHPAYSTSMQSISHKMPDWMKHNPGIKIARRNINNLRYADDTTLTADSEKELKSLLMKMKEENEKTYLKLNIQKTKILASDPITSWQTDEKKNWKRCQILFSWLQNHCGQ